MNSLISRNLNNDHIVVWECYEGRLIKLEPPQKSSEMRCRRCDSALGYSPFLDPSVSDERMWFCATPACVKLDKLPRGNLPKPQRGRDWMEFCDSHEIGDEFHRATLERIDQPQPVLDKVIAFANKPKGVLMITGTPGTGKTFAALGITEYHLRKNSDARFYKAGLLAEKWANRMAEGSSYLLSDLQKCGLLVIDDIAQGTCTPSFLNLVFEILSCRMDWSNRGTILTTNASPESVINMVGEALSDRLRTQTWIKTQGKSRRS